MKNPFPHSARQRQNCPKIKAVQRRMRVALHRHHFTLKWEIEMVRMKRLNLCMRRLG